MKGQSNPFLNVCYWHLADIPIASSNARNAAAKVCTSLAGNRFDMCSEYKMQLLADWVNAEFEI